MLLEKQDVSEIPTGFNRTPDKSLREDMRTHNFRGWVVFKESRLHGGALGCDRGFCLGLCVALYCIVIVLEVMWRELCKNYNKLSSPSEHKL